jgi:hypothetical protein
MKCEDVDWIYGAMSQVREWWRSLVNDEYSKMRNVLHQLNCYLIE